jgi:IS4 transposase
MNKEQVKTMIKSVRTDLELFKVSGQGYLLERVESNIKALKEWRRSIFLKGNETLQERMQWGI